MTSRLTPYRGYRYPFITDVVDATAVQTLAADMDQSLVNDDKLRLDAFRRSHCRVFRSTQQSITKNTLTTVTFDTVWSNQNNGANGGFTSANFWAASPNPTRVTIPVTCVVFASAFGALFTGTNLGTSGYFSVALAKNGGTAAPNIQVNKANNRLAGSSLGDINAMVQGMWAMTAGDFLEMKVQWNGTPAGPFNLEIDPFLSVTILAMP